jgi:hypothetical protein
MAAEIGVNILRMAVCLFVRLMSRLVRGQARVFDLGALYDPETHQAGGCSVWVKSI